MRKLLRQAPALLVLAWWIVLLVLLDKRVARRFARPHIRRLWVWCGRQQCPFIHSLLHPIIRALYVWGEM